VVPRGDDQIKGGDIVYFVCRKDDLPAVNYLFGFEKRKTRDIMILGGGRVGAEVASLLAGESYRVKLIDRDLERCRTLAAELEGVSIIHADAIDLDTLRDEGLEHTDVCIAVTDGDERNILYSLLAKSRGVRRAIALVNEPLYVSLAPTLGVDACISPRLATAGAILRFVRQGEVLSVEMVEECEAEVMELVLPDESPIGGKPLREIRMPRGSIIAAIVRGEDVIIPAGDDTVEKGDHLVVFSLPDSVRKVEKLFS
jgi:trk system potassium uptake protein TrkA